MNEEVKPLSWLAKMFRNKAKLTYWLKDQVYVVEVSDFKEVSSDCITFKDYHSQRNIMVKYSTTITYVLEEIK
jgi:hypothetical protein